MTVLGIPAEKQDSPAVSTAGLCAHCGTPVRRAAEQFCCSGCEFVYRTIHSLGLTGFYRLLESGDRARADKIEPRKSYAYLDDVELAKKIVTTPTNGTHTVRFYLPTIHCAACVWLLEKLPQVVQGVKESRVSFRSGIIEIRYDEARISLSEIARVLHSIGYPPVPATQDATLEQYKREDRALLRRIGVAAVCAANTMMLADSLFQASFTGIEEPFRSLLTWTSAIITLPAVLYSAYPFYRAALGAVVMGSLHIDIPISIAILASYIAGIAHTLQGDTYVYFDSITSLIFLLLLARYAQRRAIHRARASTLTAWDLFPATVRLRHEGRITEKPFRELQVGDEVEIRPGERIPSDGKVVAGTSSVEAAFLTGESRPLQIQPGSMVLGASINIERTICVSISAVGNRTRLGKIIASLENSRDRRTSIESKVNAITNAFVAAVLAATCITFVMWWWINSSRAFDIAVALLIVTCPCALGLAIPTAITMALARAQSLGIFVKNAEALQTLAATERFYFDKTGTLTDGRLTVSQSECDPQGKALAIALASAASMHPVAKVISELPTQTGLPVIENVQHVQGRGVRAELSSRQVVCLGSDKWCRERSVVIPENFAVLVDSARREGSSVCLLDVNNVVTAAFKLEDSLRPQAFAVISQLRQLGKESFILSGDSQAVVDRVADRLHIPRSHARGELYPEEKTKILELDQRITAMVGDGLNDAQAMGKASVGVGLSGGIEATLECADIFISNKGLGGFLQLYRGALATQKIIRRNLAYSIVYNVVGGALAVGGFVTPLIAAILMPISSITVIASSMMGKYFKEEGGS